MQKRLCTLRGSTGQPVQELDFTDDRLELVPPAFSQDDRCAAFEAAISHPDRVKERMQLSAGNLPTVLKDPGNDPIWQDRGRKMLVEMMPHTYPLGWPGSTGPWVYEAWAARNSVVMLNRVLFEGWDNDKAIAECLTKDQKPMTIGKRG